MERALIQRIASYYDRIARDFHNARIEGKKPFNDSIEMPAMFKLIGQISEECNVLDIGCGSGIYARTLALQGAHVQAIDISYAMLQIAQSYCHGLNVNFHQVSFEEYPEDGNTFDIVLGSFMLGYFSNLPLAFKKLRHLLKPSGFAVLSGLHPIRMSAIDTKDHAYFVQDYFASGYYYSEVMPDKEQVPLFKRTISEIVESAWASQLVVERLLEPTPEDTEFSESTALLFRCPTIIALRLSAK
jgi:2-polyprenyl-3-methyl-5-hydroxy-6-metoxy-1,4-benzoquinol methylase